jgi:hypothetical protein
MRLKEIRIATLRKTRSDKVTKGKHRQDLHVPIQFEKRGEKTNIKLKKPPTIEDCSSAGGPRAD